MRFKDVPQFNPDQRLSKDNAVEPSRSQTEAPAENSFLDMYNVPGIEPITKNDYLKYLSSKDRVTAALPDIIRRGLNDKKRHVQINSAKAIEYAPNDKRSELQNLLPPIIREGLQNGDWLVRREWVDIIRFAPQETRANFISIGLADKDHAVQESATEAIEYAPKNEQGNLQNVATGLIRKILKECSYSSSFINRALRMTRYAPEQIRSELVLSALENEYPDTLEEAENAMHFVPNQEQSKIQERIGYLKTKLKENKKAGDIIQSEGQKNEAVKPNLSESALQKITSYTPLYKETSHEFFRKDFKKSGGRTTLLGEVPDKKNKTLKHRVIIRHMQPLAYISWAKAFESHKFWNEEGFDYVPVEPIIRVAHDKSSEIAVFTRVLGPNVSIWQKQTNIFQSEINDQIEKIKTAMFKLGIKHGHEHLGNFVLVFDRTSEGIADLSKTPHVFLIDFDMAQPL